jgi:hypothetical protein
MRGAYMRADAVCAVTLHAPHRRGVGAGRKDGDFLGTQMADGPVGDERVNR